MNKDKKYLDIKLPHIRVALPNLGGISHWLPSRGNVLFTFLAIFALLSLNHAGALTFAASPASPQTSTNTFAYQGRIANSSGTPLNATTPMVFRLYSMATGGTPLWQEDWTGSNSVKVSDGLFNVMLGSLTPLPASIVTANNTLWLGVQVNSDNEMTPRVQLGSVPYSVQALTVPDGSVTTSKIADGGVTSAKLADGSVTLNKLGEQPYWFHASLATPSEWVADVLANSNYPRFCQAIGRTFSRVDEVQRHYNAGRSNGWIYPGWYYAGPRLYSDDIYYSGNTDPASAYGVWKRGSGSPCCSNAAENNWTIESSAVIWCKP